MQESIRRTREWAGFAGEDGIGRLYGLMRDFHAIGLGEPVWLGATQPIRLIPVSSPTYRDLIGRSVWLELGNSKKKVFPAAVAFLTWERGRQYLVVFFGRGDPAQPLISPRETEATLHCEISAPGCHVKFNLSRMLRDGRPDL